MIQIVSALLRRVNFVPWQPLTVRTSSSEIETDYECDFQISQIPGTLAPSRCLSADKETLETRLE